MIVNAVNSLHDAKAKPDFAIDFILQLIAKGLPKPMREFQFLSSRRFRADAAWPDLKILFEIEGGAFTAGRHTRGKGYESDCEKYNLAQLAGFVVYRFTPRMVKDGRAAQVASRAYFDGLARRAFEQADRAITQKEATK